MWQARRKKRQATAIFDDPEDLLIDRKVRSLLHIKCCGNSLRHLSLPAALSYMSDSSETLNAQVYRNWTISRMAIVTDRPKRPRLDESPSNALLKQPATGAWPSQLLPLFKERLQAGPASADDQGMAKLRLLPCLFCAFKCCHRCRMSSINRYEGVTLT